MSKFLPFCGYTFTKDLLMMLKGTEIGDYRKDDTKTQKIKLFAKSNEIATIFRKKEPFFMFSPWVLDPDTDILQDCRSSLQI